MGELKHYNLKEMLSHFQEFKYSAAVAYGDLLFCSGVIGLLPDGTSMDSRPFRQGVALAEYHAQQDRRVHVRDHR